MSAAHHAAQFHQHHSQTVILNQQLQRRRLATAAVLTRRIAKTRATFGDLKHLTDVVAEAQQAADPLAAMAAIEPESPFAWLFRLLPEDKKDAVNFIAMLAAILSLMVATAAYRNDLADKPTPSITPEQVEEIVKRVIEHQEQLHEQHAPDPTPCDATEGDPPG